MKLASVASLEGLVRLSVARLKAGARSTHRLVAALARADGRTDHWAAAVLFAMLVVLVAFTFRDYAISNDEEVQQQYGELRYLRRPPPAFRADRRRRHCRRLGRRTRHWRSARGALCHLGAFDLRRLVWRDV